MSLRAHILEGARLFERAAEHIDEANVERAIAITVTALRNGKALLVCGNGGSAADALHITGELVGRFLKDRRALKAICLNADPAVLTAWANDRGYEWVFARQVEALGEAGGVLVGLSTSGNSANVMRAFERAKEIGMKTIAMTGEGGGGLSSLSDIVLDVPSRSTPMIQQVHVCLYHYICQSVEAHFG